MMRDRSIAGRVSGRWRALLSLSVLPLFLAGSAGADDFLYPSPDSAVYRENVLSAGSLIEVEAGTQISGNLHSNGNADLKAGSAVAGNVSASGQILGAGTVTGTKTPGAAALSLPAPFDEATARGLADRIVEGNATYDTDVVIDDVLFVDGDVRFRASVNGTGTVIASGSILFDNVTAGHPVESDDSSLLSLVALHDILFGKARSLRGVALAGRDAIFDKEVRIQGVVIAGREIGIKGGSTVSFINFDRSAPLIYDFTPPDGSLLKAADAEIRARFSDDFSQVDPASVRLTVDGQDRTGEARITAEGLSWLAAPALADGLHTVAIALADQAGNEAVAGWSFTVDATPPSLSIVSPDAMAVSDVPRLEIALATDEGGSGIDWLASSVKVDDVEVASSCSFESRSALCGYSPIAPGPHRLVATLRDRAGNTSTASLDFAFLLDREAPVIAVGGLQDGMIVRTPVLAVAGTATDGSSIRSLSVNGQEVGLEDGRFQTEIALQEGVNGIHIAAYDAFGYSAHFEARVVLDTVPPALVVTSPFPGQVTNQLSIRLMGTSQDENGVASLEVEGTPIPAVQDLFEVEVPLGEGENRLIVRAVDRAGNAREVSLEVFRYTLPSVSIAFPEDLSFLAATATEVRGSVSDPSATLTVNGVSAVVSGSSFVASGVPLIEGGNLITAVARSSADRMGTASIQVVRDLFPPRLAVEVPRHGATIFEPSVTVSGMVNDIVAGTVNASEATVMVNGRLAEVANRSFRLADLPLALGENVLKVTAADESGNTAQMTLTVFRSEPDVPRVLAVSGGSQQGRVGQPLPEPFVVELRDAAGRPVPDRPVIFKMLGSDGSLGGGRRQIAVRTDASGRASTAVTLGMRAGVGNQRVEASAVGYHGPAVLTIEALAGDPARLLVDAGDQQLGIAGHAVPRPLVAVVTDSGFNRIDGAAVRWTVVKGRGHFETGRQQLLAFTDSDGRAIVPFVLEPDEGIANNIVEARIEGLDPSPVATFVASGRAGGGDPAATSVSGVVLDNTNVPVAGVTLRILDTPLTGRTDDQGQFRIAGAPVGTLRLVVDGSTVERPGSWPDLEFVVTTVPGRDNPLTLPVYLLPLDLANGLLVDETKGGIITLAEVPGFALEIAPGSVTFPGGSRSGLVSVTAVHSDKVPMIPNFGQQPRFIVTIQPAGARFDPPAKLTLPNVESLRPGEVTELYSFDHDLGHFVSIGPGTVSEDGSVIVSNPGVGILKAGWHCGGNPAVAGTPHACPACQICNGSQCVPGCSLPQSAAAPATGRIALAAAASTSCNCSDQNPCSVGNQCTGACRPLQPGTVTALADGKRDGVSKAKGKPITFSSTDRNVPDCSQLSYEWDFGDGDTSTSGVVGHTYKAQGTYNVTLKIRCGQCPKVMAQDDIRVTIITLEIKVRSGATQQNVTGGKNWAAIKGPGNMQLEAVITPSDPDAAKRIQWSGATPDPADPKLATVERSQAVRRTVTAKVDDLSDTVDIWILWVELDIRSSGTLSPTNGTLIQSGDGFPNLGPRTDEDGHITHAEAAGNVEIVGHLLPQGVYAVVKAGWEIERTASQAMCSNGVMFAHTSNPDTSHAPFLDLVPEADDNIYDTDGPTAGLAFNVTRTKEVYDTFVQHAEWNNERASDELSWHFQAWIDDDLDAANKPRNRDTVLNEVGPGPLTLPQTCHFQPRP